MVCQKSEFEFTKKTPAVNFEPCRRHKTKGRKNEFGQWFLLSMAVLYPMDEHCCSGSKKKS